MSANAVEDRVRSAEGGTVRYCWLLTVVVVTEDAGRICLYSVGVEFVDSVVDCWKRGE